MTTRVAIVIYQGNGDAYQATTISFGEGYIVLALWRVTRRDTYDWRSTRYHDYRDQNLIGLFHLYRGVNEVGNQGRGHTIAYCASCGLARCFAFFIAWVTL